MIHKNISIHNVAEIISGEADGSFRCLRVPKNVYDNMESEQGQKMCCSSTGVEIRFVMKSETAILRMRTVDGDGRFHIYRGSIQGGWEDHEVEKNVGADIKDYIIKKSTNLPVLERITNDFGHPFSPEVVRVVFDKGVYEIIDIIGDVEPPKQKQLPQKTLLMYGSSITHGSNALDMSHSWASVLAYNLKMDVLNLGMAGSCLMEPEIINHITSAGEEGKWDMAILELGINALEWEEEKIIGRVENTLKQIAEKNPTKPVFVISPFYSFDDYKNEGKSEKWRNLIQSVVKKRSYKNITYINGLEILGDMSFISADEVHPNIYGVAQIAKKLEEKIRQKLN